jgi:hypothetical protein
MAANTGILTYNSGVFQQSLVYYAPTAVLPLTGEFLCSIYCFLSRVEPWPTEETPPTPLQSQKYIKQTFKNIFAAKSITTNDLSPIIERIDWASGIVFDYYRDDIDMFELDQNDTILRRFYVRNQFDQVFKCLWNNNGGLTSVEPIFEPGTFNANQVFQGADDYKWKYMYTINSGSKLKFMDDAWMPIPIGSTIPNPVQTFAGTGSIDAINITNPGSGYDPANAAITITISGDGYYAAANAVVSNGEIIDVAMANTGTSYTYADIIITSNLGSNATAIAPASPIGGHAFDPLSELGCRHIMVTATFSKDETGAVPTDIDFRQIGVVTNPFAYYGNSIGFANAAIYKTSTDFVVSQGFSVYIPDETVYQSVDGTLENAHYTATVLSFDSTNNILKLINISGFPIINTLMVGNNSGTSRVILQEQTPSFIPYSGYMIYLENRTAVQRNPDGSEQFKLVLGY